MAKCRHPARLWRRHWTRDTVSNTPVMSHRCQCGHWLPLGPADDTPEALIEMRAAKIAADMLAGVGLGGHLPCSIDNSHCYHWWDGDDPCCRCGDDSDTSPEDMDDHGYCAVGDLARAIVMHDEEVRDGDA